MRISDWSFRRVLFRSGVGVHHHDEAEDEQRPGGDHGDFRPQRLHRKAVAQPLAARLEGEEGNRGDGGEPECPARGRADRAVDAAAEELVGRVERSEEHTSELQSLMRNSYAVFCLKKKRKVNKSI